MFSKNGIINPNFLKSHNKKCGEKDPRPML
jgi:hypothetical protein